MGNTTEKMILRIVLLFTLVGLPIALFRKPPIKDWLLLYFMDALTNVTIDKFLTSKNILKYPIRFIPNTFCSSLLFDYFFYPFITVVYNQITLKDKPFHAFYKVFFFTVPMILLEYVFNRYTTLIQWQRGWNWYHTFLSLSIKSLLTRYVIGMIRKFH